MLCTPKFHENIKPPKESNGLHNHGDSKSLCCFRTVSQVVNYLNELLPKNT